MRALRTWAWLAGALVMATCLLVGACWFAGWPPASAPSAHVPVRSTLADYSWKELGRIAEELSGCTTERAAVSLASRYGLCEKDGTLPADVTKPVELADGSTVHVTLVGVWHDVRSDGGRAGLSFLCTDAAASHAMNHAFEQVEGDDADSVGGWAASDMRQWLGDTLWYQLPGDLRSRIVRVQKPTANMVDTNDEMTAAGQLSGVASDWVGETSDLLWLPSVSELCGGVPAREDLGVDETMAAVYAGEGSQYRLFADAGVEAFAPQELLVRPMTGAEDAGSVTWWLRTKTLEFGDGFWLVGTDGTPLNGLGEDARVVEDATFAPDELWGPDHARGVVVGFCL